MDSSMKRTWAEVDLQAIAANYKALRAVLEPGCRMLGVIKANAYGHGDLEVASLLQALGSEYLAVATLDEAIHLRENGIRIPILILGFTPPSRTEELLRYDVTQCAADFGAATAMSDAAVRLGGRVRIHLKLDTGMGRLGFPVHHGEDPTPELAELMRLPGLDTEGIFTHFAVSEYADSAYTQKQFADFVAISGKLETITGQKFRIRHCANSGAMLNYKEMHLDMVRAGIALYGLYPGGDTPQCGVRLRPAMSLRTRIVQVRDAKADWSVSYGRTYTTDKPRRIAVLPIGYADGLHRVLSGKLDVLVHGRRAPQIGRICMDMCMIDVTEIPDAAAGDVATIFGNDGPSFISVDEVAEKADTISYEMLCALSPRIPRIHLRGDRTV